jgi:hypothetical protein
MQRLCQREQCLEITKVDIHNQRLSDGIERFIGQNLARTAILGVRRASG